jgi:hypothetical protein
MSRFTKYFFIYCSFFLGVWLTPVRGMDEDRRVEQHPSVEGPTGCLFIDRPDLTKRVIRELQPYTEAWVGIKLKPSAAYGFRLYKNSSHLNMHVDKSQTHVIIMIYHIDHSEDSEPWPIFIEVSSCVTFTGGLLATWCNFHWRMELTI